MVEWYITNQTNLTQTHNIMSSIALRRDTLSEDRKMDTTDLSQLLMEPVLPVSTELVYQAESGLHTNPTESSPTHKESTTEATAPQELRLPVSWRKLLRIEMDK